MNDTDNQIKAMLISCVTEKESVQRLMETCETFTGVSSNGLPLAKSGTISTSQIMILMNYNALYFLKPW